MLWPSPSCTTLGCTPTASASVACYEPMGAQLPAAAPPRSLASGFTLFPDRSDERSRKVDGVLATFGVHGGRS